MTSTVDLIKQFGAYLLKEMSLHFKGSQLNDQETILQIFENVSLELHEWRASQWYLILFKNSQYVLELDLSRVLKNPQNQYTWFLAQPKKHQNKDVFEVHLEWHEKVDDGYLDELKKLKTALSKSDTKIHNGGYLLVRNKTQKETSEALIALLKQLLPTYQKV